MVQRFDVAASWSCSECGVEQETPILLPNERGGFVDYVDYERLEEENATLRAVLIRLENKNADR